MYLEALFRRLAIRSTAPNILMSTTVTRIIFRDNMYPPISPLTAISSWRRLRGAGSYANPNCVWLQQGGFYQWGSTSGPICFRCSLSPSWWETLRCASSVNTVGDPQQQGFWSP